jgi:hypothetical protein
MKRRSTTLAFTLLAAAIATSACDDKQEAAQHAQDEADQAKAKAQADAQKAQADADKAKADMMAAFAKTQADYRVSIDKDLVDIDRTIADLRANAATVPGDTKTIDDGLLADVTARREAVRTNLLAMMSSSPSSWDATKATIDKSMDDLKTAVRAASDKIKVKTAAAVIPPTNPNRH